MLCNQNYCPAGSSYEQEVGVCYQSSLSIHYYNTLLCSAHPDAWRAEHLLCTLTDAKISMNSRYEKVRPHFLGWVPTLKTGIGLQSQKVRINLKNKDNLYM